jgi:hypothetical protein
MSVTATAAPAPQVVPIRDRLVRPPDPAILGRPLQIMPERLVRSHGAVRRLLHFAFRDGYSVLDLTYGAGGCWRRPLPPDISLTTSDGSPDIGADHHLDYRATGLPDGAYDVVVFDPPHTGDQSEVSYFGRRYRSAVRGNDALVQDVVAGAVEALRISAVGVIAKLADTNHGSELVLLSYEVIAALGRPYTLLMTYRTSGIANPRHKVQRIPDSNGAIYLAFRKDSPKHQDFDKLYARQEMSRLAAPQASRLCENCDRPIGDRRADALTCSDRCRQRMRRRGGRSAG